MSKTSAIVCAGLSCLDLQLLGCTQSGAEESIEHFEKAVYCAGGSASMTATTLSLLTRSSPSIHVYALTKVGEDFNGDKMVAFYKDAGAKTDLVLVDPSVMTSMAVLPVFAAGGRGCFVNLACNEGFTTDELLGRLDAAPGNVRAFLFGYPHLLPSMQGDDLRAMLCSARAKLGSGCVVGVDLNGVSLDNHREDLLGPALSEIDVLHLNEEEAGIVCGGEDVAPLHDAGCAVVLLSLGSRGARVSVTADRTRLEKTPGHISGWAAGSSIHVPAFQIEGDVNANGAGDALFSGFCLAAMWEEGKSIGVKEASEFASLVARQRCDMKTRDNPVEGAGALMERVHRGELPAPALAVSS